MAATPGDDHGVHLLGLNLTTKPRWVQLCIPTTAFLVGYLVNGVAEEYVYNQMHFSFGWYFTLIQVTLYSIFIPLNGFQPKQMVNPWSKYLTISAVLMASHGLTKTSLTWLNYPAQIMFKSTKVLPVMLMGAFIPNLRRTYTLTEYISAVMLVLGLIFFTLADANSSPQFSYLGVVTVCGALVMDAFAGNLQEAIFKVNPTTTQLEMLFCTSVVGAPMLLLPLLSTGELWAAWKACASSPHVYAVLFFEAAFTYVGQLGVLCLVALFGAANTAMVTTARKAFTLFLSYLIWTKPLSGMHVSGLLLISFGITMKMLPDPFGKNVHTIPPTPLKKTQAPTIKSEVYENGDDGDFQLDGINKSPRLVRTFSRSPRLSFGSMYNSLPAQDPLDLEADRGRRSPAQI